MHNLHEAEDLAQETMLKALKAIGSFEEGTNVKAWLMAILRNTRIDHLRKMASATKNMPSDRLDALLADRQSNAEREPWTYPADLLERFSDQQVIDALRELPEDICWTLLLVDVEGMDHRDAAQTLGIPVGTVKSRAHRGRMMLREFLVPVARRMRLIR